MKKYISVIFTTLFVLQSCVNGSKVWENENIDATTRYEISLLNDKLIKNLAISDTTAIKNMFSDAFVKQFDGDFKEVVTSISVILKKDTYKKIDEYNFHNSTEKSTNIVISAGEVNNEYSIYYKSLEKETYVSLLVIGNDDQCILTVVYEKSESGWKISHFNTRRYRYYGKTAPEFYKSAQENYAKSYLIDASNDAVIANKLLEPAHVWKYKKHEEIQKFSEKLNEEFNNKYRFPIVFNKIATKPQIFNIEYIEVKDADLIPLVSYLSTISIKDTIAIKIENVKLKAEVNESFIGINKNKKYVVYQAYNQIPDGKKQLKCFGIIDRIKQ